MISTDREEGGTAGGPAARRWLPGPVRAVLAFGLFTANTLFWCTPVFSVAVLKRLWPSAPWGRACERILNGLAGGWIAVNNVILGRLNPVMRWDVEGIDGLDPEGWHLVVANHQSWVDILVLQRVFHRRIPFLKFFLKKELIWVPVLGLAWWALDFPFVHRYPKSILAKKPHLRGKDLEAARKACTGFRRIPVSIMNFVEGTRFTREKHRRQNSPYRHLLRPRSGGVSLVLSAMGERIDAILDVTIVYPGGAKSFWDLLCGRIPAVRVRVDSIPVAALRQAPGEKGTAEIRRLQEWINDRWAEKDRRIGALLQTGAPAHPRP